MSKMRRKVNSDNFNDPHLIKEIITSLSSYIDRKIDTYLKSKGYMRSIPAVIVTVSTSTSVTAYVNGESSNAITAKKDSALSLSPSDEVVLFLLDGTLKNSVVGFKK